MATTQSDNITISVDINVVDVDINVVDVDTDTTNDIEIEYHYECIRCDYFVSIANVCLKIDEPNNDNIILVYCTKCFFDDIDPYH